MSEGTDLTRAIQRLEFRFERSRPIWRNRHTGKEVRVLDLAVDDNGGFQGGCRQFVVLTDEQPPPGPRSYQPWQGRRYALWAFLENWEPTGRYVPEVPGT